MAIAFTAICSRPNPYRRRFDAPEMFASSSGGRWKIGSKARPLRVRPMLTKRAAIGPVPASGCFVQRKTMVWDITEDEGLRPSRPRGRIVGWPASNRSRHGERASGRKAVKEYGSRALHHPMAGVFADHAVHRCTPRAPSGVPCRCRSALPEHMPTSSAVRSTWTTSRGYFPSSTSSAHTPAGPGRGDDLAGLEARERVLASMRTTRSTWSPRRQVHADARPEQGDLGTNTRR